MERQEPAGVGFVGLGNMGWPMARHLRQGGVDLALFDARGEQAARFADEHGGRVASNLPALARASEVVITMLPDGREVRAVAVLPGAGNCSIRLPDHRADKQICAVGCPGIRLRAHVGGARLVSAARWTRPNWSQVRSV